MSDTPQSDATISAKAQEAFEAWIRNLPGNQGFHDGCAWLLRKYDDGRYQWKETHVRWTAWQAALADLSAQIAAKEVEIGKLRAGGLWRADDGLKTAPTDTDLIAAVTVHNQRGALWWDKHLIVIDSDTGEITRDSHQGWDRSDYTHWQLSPDDPVAALKPQEGEKS